MTKLEIKIKSDEEKLKEGEHLGAYLATNYHKNDRIIFFASRNSKTVTVLNIIGVNRLHMQEGQSVSCYRDLKKIKQITVGVELE